MLTVVAARPTLPYDPAAGLGSQSPLEAGVRLELKTTRKDTRQILGLSRNGYETCIRTAERYAANPSEIQKSEKLSLTAENLDPEKTEHACLSRERHVKTAANARHIAGRP